MALLETLKHLTNIFRACQAVSDANLQGTCYTSQECTDLGGIADGNCANGFGTCCIIM